MEYEEHEKRAWSVDFSRTEPSMLVSGSDDCKVVGIWNLWEMEHCVILTYTLKIDYIPCMGHMCGGVKEEQNHLWSIC